MRLKLACAAMAAAMTCAPVSAAEVFTDAVFDLSGYSFDGNRDRIGDIDFFDVKVKEDLLPGDTLVGNVSFKDGRSFTLYNDSRRGGLGLESLSLTFVGNGGPVFFSSELSFTGVTGNYTGPSTISSSLIALDDYFGPILRASASGNLTDSSFTFTGITFRTTYLRGNATQFGIAGLAVSGQPLAVVAPVPEPATWAMMLIGFSAIGYSMRKRPTYKIARIA